MRTLNSVDSAGIGKIIRSEDPCFQVGDIVIGYLGKLSAVVIWRYLIMSDTPFLGIP